MFNRVKLMTKIKSIILFVVIILLAPSVGATNRSDNLSDSSAQKLFLNLPSYVVPYLDSNLRRDMIDIYYTDRGVNCKNLLGEKSYIDKMDSTYVKVVLSQDKSWLTIKRYTTKKGGKPIFAIVKTVATPALCSELIILDDKYATLYAATYIEMPDVEEFFVSGKSKEREEAISLVTSVCKGFSLGVDGELSISITQQLRSYLPNEIFEKISPFLNSNPLKYRWDGSAFTISK